MSRTRLFCTLAALLAAGASLAASRPGSGSSLSSSGGSAASGQTQTLEVADLAPAPLMLPLYVGISSGAFKAQGLDVKLVQFQGGASTAIPALASGSVNVASGGATNVITAIAKGALKGKFIGEMVDNGYDVIVSKKITSFQQLVGKTIGVTAIGSADQVVFEAILQHYGVKPSSVTFVSSGTVTSRLAAVKAGVIDATLNATPFRTANEAAGTVLLKAEDNPFAVPVIMEYANQSYLDAHKDVVQKYITGLQKAADYIRDPANASAVISTCVSQSKSTEALCKQNVDWATNARLATKYTWSTFAINKTGITNAISATAQSTPQAGSLKAADIIDTSFTPGN